MIRMSHAPLCAVFAASLVVGLAAPVARADDKEFFETKIRPVLVEKCYSCHSAEKKQRGGLVLDTKAGVLKGGDTGPALVAGKAGDSLLLKALQYTNPDLKMPPAGKLPAEVIADFEKWIAGGAFDPRDGSGDKSKSIDIAAGRKFWSFQNPKMPDLPAVKNAAWAKSPIDRFVLAKLEAEGLTPVDVAGRRELIRRATFDLTGLPPTPEDVDAFLNDKSPDAYASVVDRLLNSPRYGERWSRHWLDVARYAEDQAHTFGVKPNTQAFRYRDWVINALNADMPFDRFVTMQIAADLVEMPDAERVKNLPALGFFGLGAQYYKNTDAAKAAADELDDRVDTLSRGFLGLTVSCARCHDHKFDPIPTVDYYSLAGIFKSCNLADVPLAPAGEVKVYNEGQVKLKIADAKVKSFLKNEKTEAAEANAGNTAKLVLAAWSFQAQGGKKKSMSEIASAEKVPEAAVGRWVKFLKEMPKTPVLESCRAMLTQTEPKTRDQVETAAKELQTKLEDALAARSKGKANKDHNDLIKALIGDTGPLVPSDDELIKSLPDAKKTIYDRNVSDVASLKKEYPQAPPPMAHGLSEGTGAHMKVFLRGNPAKQGEEAPRRFLQVLSKDKQSPFEKGSGRLDLAHAIASKKNPLTARVIVNRLWQRHFGRGIVTTPSNFGELGDRPTHPELLDYLATRLMDQNWSLKAIHREIMLSATYQLSSDAHAANQTKDAANRWLWKHDRSRLDVEAWRDAMLAVAGTLDLTIGGPTFDLNNQSITRRTVYAKISRHDLNATLRLFDFPDANITSERRSETTVPQQQLFVLNSPFVVDTAKAFAARVQKEAADEPARVRRAFALAFGRSPREDELTFAVEYLSGTDSKDETANVRLTRWERLAQVMLAGNEFAFVD